MNLIEYPWSGKKPKFFLDINVVPGLRSEYFETNDGDLLEVDSPGAFDIVDEDRVQAEIDEILGEIEGSTFERECPGGRTPFTENVDSMTTNVLEHSASEEEVRDAPRGASLVESLSELAYKARGRFGYGNAVVVINSKDRVHFEARYGALELSVEGVDLVDDPKIPRNVADFTSLIEFARFYRRTYGEELKRKLD